MMFCCFEIVFRGLAMLARASWRRSPRRWYRSLFWLKNYLCYSPLFVFPVALFPRRMGLAVALYAWFRYADDILDGEDPCPPPNIPGFIREKGILLEMAFGNSVDPCLFHGRDRSLLMIRRLAEQLGLKQEVGRSVLQIWDHMVTDYSWRQDSIIPRRNDLHRFACQQDEAIFGLLVLVLGVSRPALSIFSFHKSGVFTRTDWLADCRYDLETGLVHFPLESCQDRQITHRVLTDRSVRRMHLSALIKEEIELLRPLWREVFEQRKRLRSLFPNSLSAFLYERFMLEPMIRAARKVYFAHGTALR